jgi:hypothetical protein
VQATRVGFVATTEQDVFVSSFQSILLFSHRSLARQAARGVVNRLTNMINDEQNRGGGTAICHCTLQTMGAERVLFAKMTRTI